VHDGSDGNGRIGRRTYLAGVAGVVGGAGVATTRAGAQESQATRDIVIRAQGGPWTNNYAGQIVIATHRPDRDGNPAVVDNCEVGWTPTQAELYNGILVDRLRDDPQKRELDLYVDDTAARIERGTPFLISQAVDCGGDYRRLSGEQIPDDGLERNASGPTVEGTGTEGAGGGDTDTGTGLPGFGALVGVAGVAGGLAARALTGRDER